MTKTARGISWAVGVGYLVVLHIVAAYLIVDWFDRRFPASEVATIPEVQSDQPTVAPIPATPSSTATPVPSPPATAADAPLLRPGKLIIPVAGIRSEQLVDSFSDARSDGRVHDAIDIAAPLGTPVLAAADGSITKFFDSKAGGITIYQSSSDGQYMYYYAHLSSRAAGLSEGQSITQGTVIGYVGDTGNAGAGNYHLHFSIALVADKRRYWEGTYIDPYPLLRY